MRLTIATGIYPPSIGGPATYSKLLNDELPHYGVTPEIVSFDEVRHLPKIISHIVYICKLISRSKGSDIMYAQDPVSVGFPALIAAFITRKKLVLKVVGDYAWEQGTQRYGVTDSLDTFVTKKEEYSRPVQTLKKIQTIVASHATKIIVPSQYLKNIVSAWGISPEKIEVIYNAFDPVVIEETKIDIREKYKLDGKICISIGRLVPWKGFETLISIMPELVKQFPDILLLIVGSGPEKEKIEVLITQSKLSAYIKLINGLPKKELLEYLKAADLFVLNTSYEGFSHQILEAMSIGIPVITTNVGGNPEQITDKENGLLVSYDNISELTTAIETLLTDHLQAHTYIGASQTKVLEFTKEKMLTHLIQVLTNL